MSAAVTNFQWFFWGYSLTFAPNGSSYIGNLDNIGLRKVLAQPSVGSSALPEILFCLYQGMFAAITSVALQQHSLTFELDSVLTSYLARLSPLAVLLIVPVCGP